MSLRSTAVTAVAFVHDTRRFTVFRFVMLPCACALALLLAPPAPAADPELDQIRAQIRELKSSYEDRIQALEQRLKDAEAKAAAPAPMPAAPSSSVSAFNPAVSVVLQGTYANLSQAPSKFMLSGFAPANGVGPASRGFTLGESELAMSANVDDKIAGNLIVSLTPEDTVSVEEAYGVFLGAPYGITPKFGRFFSGIGYLNDQHQHAWDFVDAPLAYQVFLGGQYSNDGLQLKWLAPTEQFLELGVEAGGRDGVSGRAIDRNGAASASAFAHAGGDIGASHSWRAGISYLRTRPRGRPWSYLDAAGNDAAMTFEGSSRIAIADFVWKWAPNGNAIDTSIKVQGEYLRRTDRGITTEAIPGVPFTVSSGSSSRQSGWYLQGAYQFMRSWRVGARYDRLDPGTVDFGSLGNVRVEDYSPSRAALMLDYGPSEFTRWRLQFGQSRLRPGETDNQWLLQYILSLGAHGAHKY